MDQDFLEDLQDPEYVTAFIKEWNESRLDMFALSPPNENLVFSGVMRFYFQDRGQKAATKCIRVTNKQTVADVMATLIEKFCPDMKMLSTPNYELYEIHGTGDVRKLGLAEYPLLVQLLWHHDDREGRFVLKSVDLKIQPAKFFETNQDEGQLKRRLSRREKKDLKKKRKDEIKKRNEANSNGIFEQIPESSFTRTISNPEAVMRRRRQQKLEKRMKEFTSKGGPQTGGILKIFAESLKPEIPYKTILASVKDNADIITKAALEKFLLSKEDPIYYCIVMAIVPLGDTSLENAKERIIRSSDCPLAIQNSWPKNKGHITFHLRRRAQGTEPIRDREIKIKHESNNVRPSPPVLIEKPRPPTVERNLPNLPPLDVASAMRTHNINDDFDCDEMPYFLELTPEGKEINYKPKIYYIKPQETIIGSSRNPSPGIQYLQLFSPKILASHCSIVNADGTVSIVPHGPEADVRVGGDRVYDNTLLQTGDVVQFGGLHTFRFCNPRDYNLEDNSHKGIDDYSGYNQQNFTSPPISPEQIERILNEQHGTNIDDSDDEVETTFGVDGGVETKKAKPQMYPAHSAENIIESDTNSLSDNLKKNRQSAPDLMNVQDPSMDENLLPASLAFLDHGKDAFFATVTSEVNGAAVSFKLAPTYTLYLAARHVLSPSYRAGLGPSDRSRVVATITKRIATSIQQTIQENDCYAGGLAFWMANASELLHFYRQDIDLGNITQAAQAILAQSIQESFALLVNAMEQELSLALPAFLDPTEHVDILPRDLDSILNDDLLERAESMELLNWTTVNAEDEFNDPRLTNDGYNGEQWITPAARIRYHGAPIMADVLYILSSAMSLLRRCRVNAALTIQLFSQLFHFINMWTFNRIVLEPDLKLCSRLWGHCLRMRLNFIEAWAERQGLELAADCHLARVIQAAHLLEATKDSAEAIAEVASACFKLNSLQLRTLLENYLPEMDEPIIPQDLIDSIVSVAESTADELTQTDGREVKLEEDIQLQLPFLLPEEGYSSDIIRGVPPGLQEFLEPLCSIGVCELTFNSQSHGLWTVYQVPYSKVEEEMDDEGVHGNQVEELPIERVTINKGKSGLGLSICATKGSQTEFTGIYIKAVIIGGLAAQDGRLQAGDQILSVNESSLIDVSQTQAAKIMGKCGPVITLEVMKGAAFYHGLSKLVEGEINLVQPTQPPHVPSHEKQGSTDSADRAPTELAIPQYIHQKQRSIDSGRSHSSDDVAPPRHTAPPPPAQRHKRDQSLDSNKSRSDDDAVPPKHIPPVPAHRKQKSNDSGKSRSADDNDVAPPQHIPPVPAHRKQRSNDSGKSRSADDDEVPPVPAHRKQRSTDSGKSSRNGEETTRAPEIIRSKDASPKQDHIRDKVSHSRESSNDSGVVRTGSPELVAEIPIKHVSEPVVEQAAVEPVAEPAVENDVEVASEPSLEEKVEQVTAASVADQEEVEEEEEEVEEEVQYNDSDYDSDGNLMTAEEKEKLKRQQQRQKEYEERLAKWEEQRKRQEEEKLKEEENIRLEEEKLKLEAEEKRREEEEIERQEEKRKEELAEKLYEEEVKRKQAEKIAKEEAERQRLEEDKRKREYEERIRREEEEQRLREEEEREEEERKLREEAERLLQEELQRKREEKEREEERLRLLEVERIRKLREAKLRAEEEEDDRKRLELYRIEQLKMKEEEKLRQEEERRKEKLRMIEERKRKEEEEKEIRAQREEQRIEEEEKRRKEYEAHVEKRRIEHEKMVQRVKEREEQEKREAEMILPKEEVKPERKSVVDEKREDFNKEMSSLDDALREAERIAAEMDMFMLEEEQKIEEGIKEKHEKEKSQWQAESAPAVPTLPHSYQPPLKKSSSKGSSIDSMTDFPPPPEALLPTESITSAHPQHPVETNIDSTSDEEKASLTRASNSTSSLRSQTSSTSSPQEEQQRWLLEQKEKREKYKQEQEQRRKERAEKEEEEKQKKIKEIELRKIQENQQMEEYRRIKEEKEQKDIEEAARRKIAPKPPPVKAKNNRNSRPDLPIIAPKPSPPNSHTTSSEEEEAPPRPPPPKGVKSPAVTAMNSRNSNGFPDFNRNISQSKPPDRVAPPSPPPQSQGEVFGRRTPEPVIVNQGVEVPEVLDFKSKMKLFGKFQG